MSVHLNQRADHAEGPYRHHGGIRHLERMSDQRGQTCERQRTPARERVWLRTLDLSPAVAALSGTLCVIMFTLRAATRSPASQGA